MKRSILLPAAAAFLLLNACQKKEMSENPFLTEYQTKFGIPPFNLIDTTHYMPAFVEGMKLQMEEIKSITENKEEPDFSNTIRAFDRSGQLLTQVSKVFFNLEGANTNEQMQAIARQINPMLSKHRDDIYLNASLFSRIKTVYQNRLNAGLDSQQIRVTEKYFHDFERLGANLSAADQEILRKINTNLSVLQVNFDQNLLAETNKNFRLVIEDTTDLAGLPPAIVESAAEAAAEADLSGKWLFNLTKPSMIPFLQYAKNRSLREELYRGYFMRGNNGNENDNNKLVAEIVKLRAQKARLLGYENFAAYVIDDNMAKTPEKVNEFLERLWNSALPMSAREAGILNQMIKKEGDDFKLEPWDWWYYAEKVRKEKYDLDDSALRPYFSLPSVRDGMFRVASRLYGVTFTQLSDVPVYHSDVEAFEVKEADGKPVGVLFLDYFPRDGKGAGAWCTDFRSAITETDKRVDPLVSIVCNFTKPTASVPSLLNWDEVTTLFHEFGHALHALFTQGEYYRTAGVVPNDYVELPSQVMENWAGEEEVLKDYALHYQTGEPMPDELIGKIRRSGQFNQGFETVEYLAASFLDLDFHSIRDSLMVATGDFETASMKEIGLIPQILPRYRSTYFAHVFSGDYYASGYYVYIWAAVLDADAFAAFKETGDLFNKELADRFRKYCLAESGSDEGMVQYKKFRLKDPSIDPLLIRRGLN